MNAFFENEIFFIYFLAMLSIINFSAFNKMQKISLIYFFSYGITLAKSIHIPKLCLFMLCTLFIYEEFLNSDTMKSEILYKFRYKIVDFMYMYIFQYKIIWILFSIMLSSTTIKNYLCSLQILSFLPFDQSYISISLSIISFVFGISFLWSEITRFHTYDYIYGLFQKYPYYKIDFNDELKTRLELVADIEDKTFFYRKKGYSIISFHFLKALVTYKKQNSENRNISRKKIYQRCICFLKRNISNFLSSIKSVQYKKLNFSIIRRTVKTINMRLKSFLLTSLFLILEQIKRPFIYVKYIFSRGHSTLGMQLVRIIAYEKGLSVGKPKSIRGFCATMKRKIFEILYCNMIFNGLEHYLSTNLCNPLINYRYYLVYQYLHIAQSKIGKKTYVPLSSLFLNEEVETWPIELVFISCLGLNSKSITRQRVLRYLRLYPKYNMTISKVEKIVDNINQ